MKAKDTPIGAFDNGEEGIRVKGLMANKLREDLGKKASHPPVDRFGVHFDYEELFYRLKDLETSQNLSLDQPSKPQLRIQSQVRMQPQRHINLLPTASRPQVKGKKLQLSSTLNQLSDTKSPLARAYTPSKTTGKKTIKRKQLKSRELAHDRHGSLPALIETPALRTSTKPHKKSISIFTSTGF